MCMAITEREARAAVDGGAGTVGQVLRACGTARPCGGCSPTIRRLVREAEEREDDVIRIDRYREAR